MLNLVLAGERPSAVALRVVVAGAGTGGLLGAAVLALASRDGTPGRPLLAALFGALFGLVLGAVLGLLSTLPAAAALLVVRTRTRLTARRSAVLAGLVGALVVLGCTAVSAGVRAASSSGVLVLVVTVAAVLLPGRAPSATVVPRS